MVAKRESDIPSPPDDATVAYTAWVALLTAHSVLLRHFESDHMWDEISMHEYDVLAAMRRHDLPMRMRALSESTLLSQPGLSRLVDRLVKRGLVRRAKAPQDARGILVELTPEGRAMQRRVGTLHTRSVTDLIGAALDRDEQAELTDLCLRLGNPLRKRPGTDHPTPV